VQQANRSWISGILTRPWLPFACIIAASALAHLWCLGSQFYMDDMQQIRDCEAVRTGNFTQEALNSWTTLWYVIQYRLFGMSPVAFHAGNWLLHTSVACTLFAFARDFIRGHWPAGVAWFGALWFAVHPLASEIPNYARTQDLAWVTLFSMLAAWSMLTFMRGSDWKSVPQATDGEIPALRKSWHRWRWMAACALSVAGATFSKGPGLFHALMAVSAIGLAFMPQELGNRLRRSPWLILAALVGIIATAWALGMFKNGLGIHEQWSNPRFIGHAYTLSRVFWEFAWRSVVPLALCSDHQIAETLVPHGTLFWNIPDHVAMLAAMGFLGLTALSWLLAWRKSTRLLGICLALYVATILFRVLFMIPEFMPEYRIYPGLPWFCLGTSIFLTSIWQRLLPSASPAPFAACLLAIFASLAAQRSFAWHDLNRLMANVLQQYPAQGRAIWTLHLHDMDAGNWQAVIDRQMHDWPEVRQKFIASLATLAPARELPSGHFSLAEVGCTGCFAIAVAHAKSPAEGLQVMTGLENYMHALRIDPETNPTHWSQFNHDKALVLEMGGHYQAALDCLKRKKDNPQPCPVDFARISKKLAAAKGGS